MKLEPVYLVAPRPRIPKRRALVLAGLTGAVGVGCGVAAGGWLMGAWFAPQYHFLVVPAVHASTDAAHGYFVGGTVEPRRQLTLLDGPILGLAPGRILHGVAFRRDAADETFSGGTANLTVRLSHAATGSGTASAHFDDNHGMDVTTVFRGTVELPASPPAPGPDVAWSSTNVVHVPFQLPFVYRGGTLALEVLGAPDPQSNASWWPADAVWQPTGGHVESVGAGCGPWGGPEGEWAFVSPTGLVVGGTASFSALGEPGALALLVIAGKARPDVLDLRSLGAPGCFAHLEHEIGSCGTLFGPPLRPQVPGNAVVELHVPAMPGLVGVSFASQWFAIGSHGLVSSNAHAWSLGAPPWAGLAVVTAEQVGSTVPPIGKVVPGCGHVLQFAYQ